MLARLSTTLVLAILLSGSARADEILVSAASSLTESFKQIGVEFHRANPSISVQFNFGASGALQKQIESGAPVDVFASAGMDEVEALAKKRQIDRTTRITFASNRLALVVPAGSTIKGWGDLGNPSVKRIALSDPASTPSGRYANELLTKRKLWDSVRTRAVFGHTVRQTLAYVSSGDVDAGITFITDAMSQPEKVRIADRSVPGRDHAPIEYMAAAVSGSKSMAAARRFAAFLGSPAARRILEKRGFAAPSAH